MEAPQGNEERGRNYRAGKVGSGGGCGYIRDCGSTTWRGGGETGFSITKFVKQN